MKILFAGIIARYPFGGVTWCSLMYLLGLRALGHEVFYIEDTGECVYDPVQNTRATDPVLRHHLHPRSALEPFGLGDRWAFVNYDGTYHGRSADDVRRYCAGRRPVHQSVGRLVVLARRVRADSAQGVHRLGPGVHAARHRQGRAVVRRVLPAVRPPVHVRRQHRHAGVAGSRRRRSRGTRRGSRSRSTTGSTDAPPGDRFTTVMTWQIESFADVGGNKDQEFVKFIDLPSRTPQPLRARDQRAADAAARARLGHGRRDGRVAHAWRLPRLHPAARRPSSASPSTPTCRPVRAGSAIGPSAISRRAARRSCRTPAGPRTCRRAKACSPSRRRTRRSPASTASTATTIAHARRAIEIAREHFDARVASLPTPARRRPAA